MEFWTIVGSAAGVLAGIGAVLAYWVAIPKVSIQASVAPSGEHEGRLCIETRNSGNAETTVDVEGIAYKRASGFAPLDEALGNKRIMKFKPLTLIGPDLPYRLRGNDRATWYADLSKVSWDLEHNLSPGDHGVVLLRVGAKRRKAKVQHYETIMLLREK